MLLAIAVTTLMMTGALIALNRSLDQFTITSAIGRSQDTGWVAEAGAVWGAEELTNLIYPAGASGGITLSQLVARPKLAANDSICLDGSDCSKYFLLNSAGPIPYGGGTYRVAATCYPNACTSAPQDVLAFEIRSEGILGTGSPTVIEMGFTVQ